MKTIEIGFSDNEHLCVIGDTLFIYSDCFNMDNVYVYVTSDRNMISQIESLALARICHILTLDVIIDRLDQITDSRFSKALDKLLAIYARSIKQASNCYYKEHDMCNCM